MMESETTPKPFLRVRAKMSSTKEKRLSLEQRIAYLERKLRDLQAIRESARFGWKAYEILSHDPNFRQNYARVSEHRALKEVLAKYHLPEPKFFRGV